MLIPGQLNNQTEMCNASFCDLIIGLDYYWLISFLMAILVYSYSHINTKFFAAFEVNENILSTTAAVRTGCNKYEYLQLCDSSHL